MYVVLYVDSMMFWKVMFLIFFLENEGKCLFEIDFLLVVIYKFGYNVELLNFMVVFINLVVIWVLEGLYMFVNLSL